MSTRAATFYTSVLVVCVSLVVAIGKSPLWAGGFRGKAGPFATPISAPVAWPSWGSAPPQAGTSPAPADIATPVVSIRVLAPEATEGEEELAFRICVENRSRAEAHHVLVRNPMPAHARLVRASPEPFARDPELLWQLGTLGPGVCKEIDFVLKPTGTGDIQNCARVQFEHGQCTTTRLSRPTVRLSGGTARLTVAKTGPARRYANLPAEYRITVTNTGNDIAGNVVVRDPVPEGMTFVAAGGEGKLGEGVVQWLLGAIEPGGSRSVEVVLKARGPATISNRVVATGDGDLTASAEFTTEFVGVSALETDLHDKVDPVEVGSESAYTIVVRNLGSVPATNVVINALLPAEMVTTRIEPAAFERKDQAVVFAPLTIPPLGEARYQIAVKAARAGDARLRVDLTADQLTFGPVHEEENTTVFSDLLNQPRALEGAAP